MLHVANHRGCCSQIYYYDSFCEILDCLEDCIVADLVAVIARVRGRAAIPEQPVTAYEQKVRGRR